MRDIGRQDGDCGGNPAGRAAAYFIKSMGREQGTFVRVDGTTRQADAATTKELLFEGSNRSFDQGTEDARKMHSNGVECTDSALNVHGENTNSESMARLDEQQRKVLDMLVQNGPMKSSSIADQLGVQKRRAIDILNDMTDKGVIQRIGVNRSTAYTPVAVPKENNK